MDLRVYLVNLGTYVEGNPVGAWFELPIGSEEEVAEKLKLDRWHEEFAIHGHEGFPRHMKMPGCCTVSGLNNMYEELSELEDRFSGMLDDIFEIHPDLDEAYERRYDYEAYPGMTLEDVAHALVEACIAREDFPYWATKYFDYEAYARDLSFDNYMETEHGVLSY